MLDAVLDNQKEWFERNMLKVVENMQKDIELLLSDFQTQSGFLLNIPRNIDLDAQIYNNLNRALNDAGYDALVNKLQSREPELLKALKQQQPPGAVPLAFTQVAKQQLTATNAIITQEFASVGEQSMRMIRELIFDSVTRGGSIDLLKRNIRSVLEDRLKRYAVTYANTSRSNFIQAVQNAAAADFGDEVYYEYVGPDDDLTRPACQDGLSIQFFTKAERDAFEADTASERMYNCRHYFVPVTKEFYESNK